MTIGNASLEYVGCDIVEVNNVGRVGGSATFADTGVVLIHRREFPAAPYLHRAVF